MEIDLTGITFIDEAAAVVRRLSPSPAVSLGGCELFTRQMIEAVPSGEGHEAREQCRLHPLGHGEHASGTDRIPT